MGIDVAKEASAVIDVIGDVMGNSNISPYILFAAGALVVGVGIKYAKKIVRMLRVG